MEIRATISKWTFRGYSGRKLGNEGQRKDNREENYKKKVDLHNLPYREVNRPNSLP